MDVTLRPSTDEDTDFLHAVYASTRQDELAGVPWDEATKAAFLLSQARAQDADYRRRPEAEFLVITADTVDAGRLYRALLEDGELRLMDVALLPEWRGRGIGTRLLEELIEECRLNGWLLSLHVEQHNQALRLYQRLGFVAIGDDPIYQRMELRAS